MVDVMGIVNVNGDRDGDRDRDRDGGLGAAVDAAVTRALELLAAGADLVDVGAASTRPGAPGVDATTDAARTIPVVTALAGRATVSINTRHAGVAEAAVGAGATVLNDTSGRLWPVAAAAGVAWCVVHAPGGPDTPFPSLDAADDAVVAVRDALVRVAESARAAGVDDVWIDPGIGFGKTPAQSLALLARIDELVATGIPVLLGASRKSSLARLSAWSDAAAAAAREPALPGVGRSGTGPRLAAGAAPGAPSVDATWQRCPSAPPDERDDISVAVAAWGARLGVRIIRAHDVAATVAALRAIEMPTGPVGTSGRVGGPR